MRIPSPLDFALAFDRRMYQPIPKPLVYPRDRAHIKGLRELRANTYTLAIALQCLITIPVLLGWFFDFEQHLATALGFGVISLYIFWLVYRTFRVRDYLLWFDIVLRLAKIKEEIYDLHKLRD